MTEEDYMSDSGDSPAEPQEESKGTKTALLPLDFLAGKKLNPGDTITLKVAKVGDDQLEVELASEAPDEVEEETEKTPAAADEYSEMMG